MIGPVFIGVVIGLLIDFIIALKFKEIAIQKGCDETKTVFLMCFFLGLVGYLYVIALPDLTTPRADSKESICDVPLPKETKIARIDKYRCAHCGELIDTEQCPWCGKYKDK